MPRPSQEQKILDAALSCFAALGYDGTRIKHIAERAEVSEGALYRHYRSKEEVAQALFIEHMGAFGRRWRELAGTAGTVETRLRLLLRAAFAAYRAQPAAITFVLLQKPQLTAPPPSDFVWPLEVVEDLVREGQAAGTLRDGQPNLLAAIFLGCLLRPVIVSQYAAPGALDLLGTIEHDSVIEDAALAALARPASKSAPTL